MRNRKRAFSLAEVVFILVMMAILTALALKNFGSERGRASSEGMVQVVVAELEAARGKALSSRLPVAFCLPSEGGSRPHTQSFYLMEGQVEPKPTQTRTLAGDFAGSYIAAVYWGAATMDRPQKAGSSPRDAVARWLGRRVDRDFALVFMPDGSVMSNDVPLMDGEYRLLVASGLKAAPASPGGSRLMPVSPQNFKLEEAFAAHTISISPQGEILANAGVKNPTGVKIALAPIGVRDGAAQPSLPAPLASTEPRIRRVSVYPKPFLEPKATVPQERNLTLTVEATDADGQELFCTWESVPVPPAIGTGAFSLEADHPMVWDAKMRKWISKCTWAPPSTANAGDQFVLTCRVVDPDGNRVDNTAHVLDPVTVIPPGKILFDRGKKSTWNREVAIINADGTGLRYLTDGAADNSAPSLSPDGSMIAYVNDNVGSKGEIFIMNVDGTGKRRLTNHNSNKFATGWSPDGTKVIYCRNWPDRLYSCNLDGSGETRLSTIQGSSSYSISFSPDGRYICNVANMTAPGVPQVSGEIIVSEWVSNGTGPPSLNDSTNVTNNSSTRTGDGVPTFIPGSATNELVWAASSPGPSGTFTDSINALTKGRLQDNGPGTVPRFEIVDREVIRTDGISQLVFSPDARKVIFVKKYPTYGLFVADWDGSTSPPTIKNDRRLTGFTQAEYPRAWTRY